MRRVLQSDEDKVDLREYLVMDGGMDSAGGRHALDLWEREVLMK